MPSAADLHGVSAAASAALAAGLGRALVGAGRLPYRVGQGFEVVANTPEQFTAFQASEFARWKKVIEDRKITAD